MPFEPKGRVHRSVAGSFPPLKIILPLYQTVHCSWSNVTLQSASVSARISKMEAVDRSGMMWPVSTVGRPSIYMSHMYVDITCLPLVSATLRGCVILCFLMTGVPSITKICAVPESAMESLILRQKCHSRKFRLGKDTGKGTELVQLCAACGNIQSNNCHVVIAVRDNLRGRAKFGGVQQLCVIKINTIFIVRCKYICNPSTHHMDGNCVLCLFLVEQGWPKLAYCCTFC
jgi:hypothetical protein